MVGRLTATAVLTLALVGIGSQSTAESAAPVQHVALAKQDVVKRTSLVSRSALSSTRAYKVYAYDAVLKNKWSSGQFICLEKLWARESHWNPTAHNSSGAHGIPQALPGSKMASVGSDWRTSAATQIDWGIKYIKGRYGTPCGAWSHSNKYGWY